MLRILEAQAPAKQTAADTISTLSSRLNNATLLEDRRGAILGLRSFAKEYPASVASGSLRSLIGCLARDLDDVDTIKVVLETLLMLFNPNEQSPEAGEEIALWLADEFTQRQDNIKILLDLLETNDFYSRLYSLQLLTAIFSARPARTQECVLNAALGTSRLVATLDDRREAVRNAGLLLLGDLTQSSTELQKLVAFENTFDRLFSLLQLEGGLSDGGIIVQDCLDLLANLIRQNSSNQSLFRESGCIPKLSELLTSAYASPVSEGEEKNSDEFPNPQRDKNLWGLLAVIRLFLVSGSAGTQLNQKIFHRHGVLQQILDLPFRDATEVPIRAEALYTCADIIRGNPELQAAFAQLQVPVLKESSHQPETNGTSKTIPRIYIIDALLDLVIVASSVTTFNVRLAACECLKAYLFKHVQIRLHFLNRAIELHMSGEEETANVLSTLVLEGAEKVGDPSRLWFASVLLLHLIWDDRDAKRLLMKVSEGDADSGEEVVTCIQAIAGNLIAAIQRDEDERLLIGYLMLLCGWLYEDAAAVDDFLQEGSLLQSLVQTVSSVGNSSIVVKGLSAVLIGIVYEYSTKDSPIPRRKIHPILTAGLGREQYLQALSQLRQHPFVRDYEVFSQQGASAHHSQELPPYAYFDSTFIEFLKDNFSRFSRAIDRDPGIEIQITSGEQGIDRDLVDSLRSQIEDKNEILEKAETQILNLEQKLDQDQASHRKEVETANSELQRIKQVNEALQANHEAAISNAESQNLAAMQSLQSTSSKQAQDLNEQIQSLRKSTSDEAERTKDYYERLLSQARSSKTNLDTRLANAQKSIEEFTKNLEEARKTIADLQSENTSWKCAVERIKSSSERKDQKIAELQSSVTQQEETAEDEKTKVTLLEKEVQGLEGQVATEKKLVAEMKEAKASVQTELDDLLMVFGDVEEKRKLDKKRLKALGEEVSDADDDDDDDEEADEDDVD